MNMIKIQPVVREIVLGEVEALFALTNGYMNMSSYAYQIRPKVELLPKKKVTIASLVVTLSRLRKELKKEKPMIHKWQSPTSPPSFLFRKSFMKIPANLWKS